MLIPDLPSEPKFVSPDALCQGCECDLFDGDEAFDIDRDGTYFCESCFDEYIEDLRIDLRVEVCSEKNR